MRRAKAIKRILVILVIGAILVTAVLFIQASRSPAGYRPARLSLEQRQQQVNDFARDMLEFSNKAQRRRAYTLSFSQDRLNRYLASMDEIAAGLPGRTTKPGDINRMMAKLGLAEPAIVLGDGAARLMVRSIGHDKILSVDVALSFPSPEQMSVDLLDARIGRLPLPEMAVDRILRRLKRAVRSRLAGGSEDGSTRPAGLSSDDVASALVTVIGAIGESPIGTAVEIDGIALRIVAVDVTPAALTLHVEPTAPSASAPRGGETVSPARSE